ncbi:amino acid permease-associated region [Haladaptatus paucihalophilus DX253]|uniref:Amino acid permease-associated region n=1 Tax=Haladaptatus paucihalophilus DX253 TaxID=797209 RepID=E7QZR8_HALPU|nr:amino acid permease [Haladaptatus paucihalophilus]EFW89812.1 amino acid permease-associated region [Haladaptatus paucihalophilus DX253]SHK55069.1 amino acid/polyamine/organocation transporter, APC superfamily [Haladaptatus paucihalophilus DX253]
MADEELAKDLGPLAALTIGVGTMIGAGIFVLPGVAAAEAGPLVILSFIVGGGVAVLTAFSASELGTAMPKAGGAYYYINHALGPLFGSIAGWGNWMGLAFASAFYMLGFGQYVTEFLSVPSVGFLSPSQLGALVAGSLFVLVNYVGAKETGRLQNIIVVTLVGILTVFSVVGAFHADLSTLRPFAPNGITPLLPTTGLIFVSYLGFVQITSVGEEIQNPGKNLPRAVIGSVVIVTIIYALVLLVLLSVVELNVVANNDTAVVEVASMLMGPAGAVALTFGGLLATASSANASILASSRINFAMGRDKLVSNWLNDIHDRFTTPYRSIGVTGGLILLFVVIGDVEVLATAGSVLHLVIYGLLNVALIVMREADTDDYHPDYRVPLYPYTPILGALTSFGLIGFMASADIVAPTLAVAFVVGAVGWYFLYARRKTEKQGVLTDHVLSQPEAMPESAVSAVSSVKPDGGDYRVMVPLANPEHETDLISLASAVASQRGGTVVATHIVQVPDQTPLASGAAHVEELDAESAELLERARADAETFGVPVETHTILSHRSFEEIFDAARTHAADLVVMGWGEDSHGSPGRAESAIDELTNGLPCDVVVLRDRGFDPGRVLVPTAGGPDSELSAAIAQMLQAEYDSELSLLHVTDESRDAGEEFLADWATEHGIEDANLVVVDDEDVEAAIERAAGDCSLLVIGATEEGLLSRLVRGSLALDIVDDVDCSVLLAEKQRKRSMRERLIG